MIKIFTILSEFTQYTEEQLLKLNEIRLHFYFGEALRQRASKARLLSELILAPHKEKEQHQGTINTVNLMLFPHGKPQIEYNKKAVDDTWNFMRAKRK